MYELERSGQTAAGEDKQRLQQQATQQCSHHADDVCSHRVLRHQLVTAPCFAVRVSYLVLGLIVPMLFFVVLCACVREYVCAVHEAKRKRETK